MLRGILIGLFLTINVCAQVPIGASKKEVIDKLGWPKSTSTAGTREILYYPEFSILIANDRVEKLQFNPKDGSLPNTYTPAAPKRIPPAPAKIVEQPAAKPRENHATPNRTRVPTPEEQLGPIPDRPAAKPSVVAPAIATPTRIPAPTSAVVQQSQSRQRAPFPQDPTAAAKNVLFKLALFLGLLLGLKLVLSNLLKKKRKKDPFERFIAPPLPPIIQTEHRPAYREPVRTEWSLHLLKEIEWHRFEHLVAAYERELGNDAVLTDFGPDGGIDIKVFEKEERTPKRLIQCKAFDNKPVSVELVRQFMGAMLHEKAPQGAFYTTSAFTPPALELGRDHPELELVDGPTFLNHIMRLQPVAQSRLIEIATEGEYTIPTCSSCGVKMILRTAGKGRDEGSEFWGCRHYPRCKQTLRLSKAI